MVTTAIKAKLRSSGTMAILMTLPHDWSRGLSETDTTSFWTSRIKRTMIAKRAMVAIMAMLVTVVTVVVVTVEIIVDTPFLLI